MCIMCHGIPKCPSSDQNWEKFLFVTGFQLTFQSCIQKNSYKTLLALVLTECPPWFDLRDFACCRLMKKAFSSVN